MTETIAIAADHAGVALKDILKGQLRSLGFEPLDLGTTGTASVDYPDIANALTTWVCEDAGRRGVLICGSGIGVSIAANRHKGIRAALCRSGLEAELSRRHNDANVVCLGERITGTEMAKDVITKFLTTPFDGGRHQGRVEKMG